MKTKHGPNRLAAYLQIHETVMDHWLRNGFVVENDLLFLPVRDLLYLSGTVRCLHGLCLEVEKEIGIGAGPDGELMAQTSSYSYHAMLPGGGNIFRYDSPHATHNQEHHVHRYQVLSGDVHGSLTFLLGEGERPTLGEAIAELEQWYYDHYDELNER